ncbi:MAG: CPBP family intramembrane glutamic endopeptidase [Pseudomonadales bacterium]
MTLNGTQNRHDGLAPSQRRLQRPADFTGPRLTSFRAVALRHGLPGALLGMLCLLHPDMRALLTAGLGALLAAPLLYLAVGASIFLALISYAGFIDRRLDAAAVGWIIYLLLVSIWEEWVFRVAIPYFAAANGAPLLTAVIASNAIFALMHYFTLRWKWQWCVAAFLGGMALSRQFGLHADLALVIGIHWIATFLNTPRLPGRARVPASSA